MAQCLSRILIFLAVVGGALVLGQMAFAAEEPPPPSPPPPAQAYIITHQWDAGRGYFGSKDGNRLYVKEYRITDDPVGTPARYSLVCGDLTDVFAGCEWINLEVRNTYFLNSACKRDDTACYDGVEPVLFIHGYKMGTKVINGGGQKTWADFPRLTQEAGYLPFEYRWNTGTRFQDAAIELDKAIDLIHEQTGARVHIIAHSFGGLLVRTLLQGIHLQPWERSVHRVKMSLRIASVATLGTPHSGIFPKDACRGGKGFPEGQDTSGVKTFSGCGQLTCQQAGQDVFDGKAAQFFGVEDEAGELMPKLADFASYPLPSVDILALIGLTTPRAGNGDLSEGTIIDPGDGLITYEGQRFLPSDIMDPSWLLVSCDEQLPGRWGSPWPLRNAQMNGQMIGQARLTERILGFPDDTLPGGTNPFPGTLGYRHSTSVWGTDYCAGNPLGAWSNCNARQPPAEAYVVCDNIAVCEHQSFLEVLAWIQSHSIGPETFSTCNTLTPENFYQPAYNNYGAPFDLFGGNAMLVDAKCSSSDKHTIKATLGIPGNTTRFVYMMGYYYDHSISKWKQYTPTCNGTINGDWCVGSATANITDPNISTDSASAPTYFVGYVCSWQNGQWKCGCRDATCINRYWQLQGAGR